MKKFYLVPVCAVLILAVGCGKKNQVKCTGKQTENGITIKAEVIADLDKNDKLTDAKVVYDLSDKKTAQQYCALFKLMENADKGISINCSGSKVTIKGFAEMETDEDGESIVGMSKKDFIKQMEEENMTCK